MPGPRQYRRRREPSEATKAEYRGVLDNAFDRITPPFGPLDPVVPSWSASRLNVLACAIRWAKQTPYGEPDPDVDRIPMPAREPHVEIRAPSESGWCDYERVALELPPAARALAVLPLRLGLRVSELARLSPATLSDALTRQEMLVLRKGGKEQYLPVDHCLDPIRDLLSGLKEGGYSTAGALLSSGNHDSQVNRIEDLVRDVGEHAGIPDLHPHLLRHGFATRLNRDGAPLRVIQKWLGHANIQTTVRYVNPDADDMRKYVRR